MDRTFFNQQFAALVSAYVPAQRLPEETQDVYWAMLQDIPAKKFADGVRRCLATSKFFPTIAELGAASMPIKTRLRPYNPYVRQELLNLDWEQQISESKQAKQKRIEENK
jgi:hypothetical protein